PFDRASVIVECNDKVLAAGDDQRIVAGPVRGRVVMKPIGRSRIDELGGVVTAGSHSRGNDSREVPCFEDLAVLIHFDIHGSLIIVAVRVQKKAGFTWIDVVCKPNYARSLVT